MGVQAGAVLPLLHLDCSHLLLRICSVKVAICCATAVCRDKMIRPRYQDYQKEDVPVVESRSGCTVRVMAGSFEGQNGPIELRNPGLLMDVSVVQGGAFTLEFPTNWNAFAYVFEGEGHIGDCPASMQTAYVLGPGTSVAAATEAQVRLPLLFASATGAAHDHADSRMFDHRRSCLCMIMPKSMPRVMC
jgi:Pirin C-terminal cupin domain